MSTTEARLPPPVEKVRMDEFSDQVTREFVNTMGPDERKFWGQVEFQRRNEERAYKTRSRGNLEWLAVGSLIGIPVGVLLTWVLIVNPLLLQIWGVL